MTPVHLVATLLQPDGKKRISTEEFLRGQPIANGCRFGPELLG